MNFAMNRQADKADNEADAALMTLAADNMRKFSGMLSDRRNAKRAKYELNNNGQL
jgi:hypothetical protein